MLLYRWHVAGSYSIILNKRRKLFNMKTVLKNYFLQFVAKIVELQSQDLTSFVDILQRSTLFTFGS